MTETIDILEAVLARHERGDAYGLATVVSVRGSTYRLPGARQLVAETGESVGTVSGGCLDADVQEVARAVLASGRPRLITFDLTANDEAIWGWGLGCNGATEIFVEPPDSAGLLARRLRDAMSSEQSLAVVTVLESADLAVGSRIFVRADGSSDGSLGSDAADRAAGGVALGALEAGAHQTTQLSASGDRVFFEIVAPPPRLLVCGAGHDAIPLVRLGSEFGLAGRGDRRARQVLGRRSFPRGIPLRASPSRRVGRFDRSRPSHRRGRDEPHLSA